MINAKWKASIDVVKQYRAVTRVAEGTFLFPIEDFDGFVELQIAFPQGVALITAVQNRL
ncbi:MAG: hypothetical protein IPI20_16070 [Rhodoferax sp.]|nr:hypothetical protein [Rhodoferax sp.]